MDRPVVFLTAALALGVVGWVLIGWAAPLVAGGGALAVVASQRFFGGESRPAICRLAWIALALAAGAFYAGVRTTDASIALRAWEGREVSLTGRVDGEPAVDEGRAGYYFRVNSIDGHETHGRIAVSDYRRNGITYPSYGDRLRLSGRLETPRSAGNPGEFDYAAYLARQGVFLRLAVWNGENLEFLGPDEDLGPGVWLIKAALRTRKSLDEVFRRLLPPGRAALISGLLFGTRGDLPPAIQEDFRQAGIYHLLAVSGSNVAFVALPFLGMFLRLGLGRTKSALLTCPIVVFYVFLTGASASVVRAGIMAILGLLAQALGRKSDSWNSLAVAGLGIILINPLTLYDAGFQLSFAATAGILALARSLEKTPWIPGLVRAPLAVTLAAQLAVLPVSLFYFAGVSAVSLAANLVVIPIVAALVYLGSAVALLGWLWLPLAAPLIWLLNLLLALLEMSALIMARLPGSYLYFPAPSGWLVISYYLGLAWAFGLLRVSWLPGFRAWTKTHRAIAVIILGAVLIWRSALGDPPGTLEAVFLDVGQGDAIFVLTPGRRTVLIDGGGKPEGTNAGGYDPGERVLTPFLRRRGITRIDDLVLTHPHGDHVGGLEAILRNFEIGRVWYGGRPFPSAPYQRWLSRLSAGGVPYAVPRAGDLMVKDEDLAIRFLHPGDWPLDGTRSDENNNSLVLKIDYGQISFLLTGDIESEGEKHLLAQRPGDLAAAVLKVGHHGSDFSSTGPFLDQVGPALAIIQVGRNSFGHPGAAAVERLESRGIEVLRNDLDGAVTVKTDGRGLAVDTFRSR